MIVKYICKEDKEKIDINEYRVPGQSSKRGYNNKLYKKRLKKDVRKLRLADRPRPDIVYCYILF